MKALHLLLASLSASVALIAASLPAAAAPMPTGLPAFPGAEGFGSTTPGGRGGQVLFVTTLADSGPGSLREACDTPGPRIVVFRVSGTIQLESPIVVREPYLTLAGQTAPGDGICIRDQPFGVATHDVVIRYLRFRLGDETAQEADCLGFLGGASNSIIDHCSATWSVDECLSLSGRVENVTIQWCLIGESLHQSKHAKGAHGFGSLSRANGPVSWHHNLWLHNHSRNPRLGDDYGRPPPPFFDVRNNVLYNYISTGSGLTQGEFRVNYVGNYIRPGPHTRATKPISIGAPSTLEFFVSGNVVDDNEALTSDNSQLFNARSIDGRTQVRLVDAPFPAAPVTTTSAAEALEQVLAIVGASRPRRDAVDTRLVADVRNRGGGPINSQSEVGGWPELVSETPPVDADQDGMPYDWERAHGLDPGNPHDHREDPDGDGYTNIEEWLNGTDPRR